MLPSSPRSPRRRILRAYWTTFVVVSSYLWLRTTARLRTRGANQRALERANLRNARRIYRAILELQGLFIKVGQLFSIMTNFLPEAFRGELEGLQDRVPPREYDAIASRIRDEFDGRGPDELFASFDRTPVASASIGQVHLARLPGGKRVAVKVQYPDIDQVVRADLTALRRIFSVVQRFFPYQGMDAVYREIRAMILQELDFTAEARNLQTIAANFKGDGQVGFPGVVVEYTTERVITTEFVDGVKINDVRRLDAMGVDRSRVARLVIDAYCQQIFHHGIYHADPHPGNILVSEGPTIKFIDFGAVAEVSDGMRQGMVSIIQGAINRDTNKIVSALRQMGFIAHTSDPRVYDRVVDYFHSRFQEEVKLESFNLRDIKLDPARGFENLADLRQMNISMRDLTSTFHVPKEWIMLERTILLLMGLCTTLDPNLNPMDVIRPHIEEFVLGKDRDLSRFLLDTARDVGISTLALPQEIRNFTTRALQGDLEFSLRDAEKDRRLRYALGHQVIYTALGIALFAFALWFEERQLGNVASALLVGSGAASVMLLRSFWRARRWL